MIRCQLKRLGVIAVAVLVTVVFGFVASESIGFEDKDKNSVGLQGQHDEILGAGELEENSGAEPDRRAAINSQSRDDQFKSLIAPFLKKHCYKCHGSEKSEGDRRFDLLDFPLTDDNALIELQDVLDQLNLGEMPPLSEPQPDVAEASKVIRWLTAEIAEFQNQRKGTGGETVLRRINRR